RALADALVAVLLAPSCAACGELLDAPTAGPICAGCWAAIAPITPPVCDRCGDPLPTWRERSLALAVCARCRRRGTAVDRARTVGLPVVHALRRVRATATQADLPAAQRHRNVRDAFAATRSARALAGAVVLLVDDVSTTGATLDACARALKAAGVSEVRAVT